MVKREATEAAIPSWSFHLFQRPRSEVRFIIVKVRLCHVCCVYKKQKSLKSRRWKSETTRWNHLNISWNIQLIQNSQYGWYSNDWSINSLIDLILAQLASVASFPPVSSSQLSSLSVCYLATFSCTSCTFPSDLFQSAFSAFYLIWSAFSRSSMFQKLTYHLIWLFWPSQNN